jgi:small subunit ribosomal protein S20
MVSGNLYSCVSAQVFRALWLIATRYPHAAQSSISRNTLTTQSAIQRKFSYVANIKSQKKRILTNEKARQRNNSVKSELKTAIRAVNTAVEGADKDAAATALQAASRKLDKAVSKGVLHRNNAANRKSAISKKVNAL